MYRNGGGGARSLISYIEVGSCLCRGLIGLPSFGKREYEPLRACARNVVGDLATVGAGIEGTSLICASIRFGEKRGGLLIDSMLITRPFSAPMRPARLSARLSKPEIGVRGPGTGSFNCL